MGEVLLVAVAVVVPLVALVLEHAGNVRITERHHSHHDTYVVSAPFRRSIVLAMTFFSALGLVLAWLCEMDVFIDAGALALVFTDGFVLMCFVLWCFLCRYRVSTFRDCMTVTPFVGPRVWVRYDQIERLEWSGMRMESGFRSLVVWVDGRPAVTLLGIVDVEQIIMSIDRYDLLPQAL